MCVPTDCILVLRLRIFFFSYAELYPNTQELNEWIESAKLDPNQTTYDFVEFIMVGVNYSVYFRLL